MKSDDGLLKVVFRAICGYFLLGYFVLASRA